MHATFVIRRRPSVLPTSVMLRAPSKLALTGPMDRRIVNIADDEPSTLYEMARAVGITIESSAQPLNNPWRGRADATLSRSLGFRPTVATLSQALQEGIL
jgi:hypothetical protein